MGQTATLSERASTIESLREFGYEKATVSFWLLFRRLRKGAASYTVGRVELDDALSERLRNTVRDAALAIDDTMEYDFLTEDADGRALCLDLAQTDFGTIGSLLGQGADAPRVEKADDFFRATAYIVELQYQDSRVWGQRKVAPGWTTKGKKSLIWKQQKLHLLDAAEIVRVDDRMDCIVHADTVFVIDKANFEVAMNYRARMRDLRDAAINELAEIGLFSSETATRVREAVGDNLHYMRRLSAIQKNGYHRSDGFLTRLLEINESESWGIPVENGQLAFDPDRLRDLLYVLNNDRLTSLLDEFTYDVAVKRRFAES